MKRFALLAILLICIFLFSSCGGGGYVPPVEEEEETQGISGESHFDYSRIPEFDGETPYVVVNGNMPYFKNADKVRRAYESYGKLDNLGRCTAASANIGKELMPTKERGSIAKIKPTGWQIEQYDCVDGSFLYNRCHLIGYQLTGENANERNLITGTRFFNTQGMLPFENMVADYIKETRNHVLYRVTPIFENREVVARGVLMEAFSVEDKGEGVCFNVFCYNVQPDIEIDYKTGKSRYVGEETSAENGELNEDIEICLYVLNTNTMKIHKPTCQSVIDMDDMNRLAYRGSIEELCEKGYSPCGSCRP